MELRNKTECLRFKAIMTQQKSVIKSTVSLPSPKKEKIKNCSSVRASSKLPTAQLQVTYEWRELCKPAVVQMTYVTSGMTGNRCWPQIR